MRIQGKAITLGDRFAANSHDLAAILHPARLALGIRFIVNNEPIHNFLSKHSNDEHFHVTLPPKVSLTTFIEYLVNNQGQKSREDYLNLPAIQFSMMFDGNAEYGITDHQPFPTDTVGWVSKIADENLCPFFNKQNRAILDKTIATIDEHDFDMIYTIKETLNLLSGLVTQDPIDQGVLANATQLVDARLKHLEDIESAYYQWIVLTLIMSVIAITTLSLSRQQQLLCHQQSPRISTPLMVVYAMQLLIPLIVDCSLSISIMFCAISTMLNLSCDYLLSMAISSNPVNVKDAQLSPTLP